MPSPSSDRLAPISLALFLLAGCASAVPPLPPDTTSINRTHDLTIEDFTPEAKAMTCDDIAAERKKTADAMKAATATIDGNRERNVIMLAVAAWAFTPMILATNNNNAEKDDIAKLYEHQDMLIKLATLKHCSATPAS